MTNNNSVSTGLILLAPTIHIHIIFFVGKYWIDPNGGVPNDAILVLCDFETLSTCVLPKVSKVEPHNVTWLSR